MKDDSAGLVDLVGSYAIRPLVGVQRVARIHGVLAGRDSVGVRGGRPLRETVGQTRDCVVSGLAESTTSPIR